MTERPIRIIGDPVLRTPCDPIGAITDGVRTLVADLVETVDRPGRAGLAANQIGISLRAFSWNLDGLGVGYVLNPVITELGDGEQTDDEGCLSLPDLWYPRTRGDFARVEGHDLDGEPVVLEGDGIIARLIQHEVGHLDGALYIDGLERRVRKRALRDIRTRF